MLFNCPPPLNDLLAPEVEELAGVLR
jgi:hypothetical protein